MIWPPVTARVLLVAPHADDELLGAGATLLGLRDAGASIKLALVACSDVVARHGGRITASTREAEFRASAMALSTEPPDIYWMTDGGVSVRDIVPMLDATIDSFVPTMVLLPEPGCHQDHRATYEGCIAALRPSARGPVARVMAYEVPTSTWSGIAHAFEPHVYVDVTARIDQKLLLMERCYASQYTETERRVLAEHGIRRHAAYRGIEAGVDAAEAFALLREVIR